MTATVAELAERPHRDVGYVLFIEGCPFAFTDRVELVGSGGDSWIGTGNGARRVVLGLGVPDSITYYTNPEHGMLTDDDEARFEIADFDGEMIAWFEDVEYEQLGQRLGPKDDPAPDPMLNFAGENLTVHGKFVGVEAIGSAGQRRRFQLFPGDPLPGYDHAALSHEVASAIAPVGVFTAPPWIVGRKLALYLIFRNVQTDEWPSWDDHYSSGYSLIWWGTCSEMGARGKQWSMRARGPSSWLAKMLNANRPDEWGTVQPFLALLDEQTYMAVDCWYDDFDYGPDPRQYGNYSAFDETDDKFGFASGTAKDFANFIDSRLQVVLAAAGPDITWTTNENEYCYFLRPDTSAVIVRVADSTVAAFVRIVLHERVWRYCGFDPLVQPTLDAGGQRIAFQRFEENEKFGKADTASAPSTDYWVGTFSTIPADADGPTSKMDNEGDPRHYYTFAQPGQVMLDSQPGQEVDLGSAGTPYFEGQLNLPPKEYELSHGSGVDSVGFVVFSGPYRSSYDADTIEMVQVAKVTWTDNDGTPLLDSSIRRLARIEEWLDPRWFGLDNKKFSGTWAASVGTMKWRPFALLGYDTAAAERAHIVMLRVLLSTGTAGWTGFLGDGATQAAGDNAHPDAPAGHQANDLEIADLGLGIYHGLVDYASFFRAANAMPGGANGSLARCKIGKVGAFDARELLAAMMMPRGWQLGLRGGQYSMWQMLELSDEGEVDVVLTQADVAGDEIPYVEDVEFDPITPIDNATITYGEPIVEGPSRELSITARARDIHARARNSNADKAVENVGMVPHDLWGAKSPKGTAWDQEFRELWGEKHAEWRSRPHLLIKGLPLHYRKGKLCAWPGATVSFSSSWPATRSGSYGIAGRVGRVIRATRDLRSAGVRIDVLLEPTTRRRRFAPEAWVLDDVSTLEARLDVATRTFYCYADYRGVGDAEQHDVKYFAEPSWFGVGGDAKVYGYQHDGRSWSKTFEFLVESVSTANDSITYQDGSFSGTFWERMYTVLMLAPYSDQPTGSWTKEFFAFNTKSNGKMGAGNVQGFKLS